jgi:hypothetical protein
MMQRRLLASFVFMAGRMAAEQEMGYALEAIEQMEAVI